MHAAHTLAPEPLAPEPQCKMLMLLCQAGCVPLTFLVPDKARSTALRDPLDVHGVVTLHGLDVADVDNTGRVGLATDCSTKELPGTGGHATKGLRINTTCLLACRPVSCSTTMTANSDCT